MTVEKHENIYIHIRKATVATIVLTLLVWFLLHCNWTVIGLAIRNTETLTLFGWVCAVVWISVSAISVIAILFVPFFIHMKLTEEEEETYEIEIGWANRNIPKKILTKIKEETIK